jgi:predicted acyltransferase (DUF342 family)
VGLSAVVYKNKKHIDLGNDKELAEVVLSTGEIYFQNNQATRKYAAQLRAVECRLGNVAEIAAVREEASRFVASESVLLREVLYSGTHSGDVVSVQDIALLSSEISSIGNARQASPELRSFARLLGELVRAAQNERNPIVFV